jgi:hypothetical protein
MICHTVVLVILRENIEIDTLRQVWFYSRYDVKVHPIELEQSGNSLLPTSRVSQGRPRKILILPGSLTTPLPALTPMCWRRLAAAFLGSTGLTFGMHPNG